MLRLRDKVHFQICKKTGSIFSVAWDFDYTDVKAISAVLNENGLSMSKKFGQNFLISASALDKIVSSGEVGEGSVVWEIGPGLGALTSRLLKAGCNVTAFEIDHGFCRILESQAFSDEEHFHLVEGDALKNWPEVFKKQGTPDAIIANLPYNVGSVFIASLIENRCLPEVMVFTLQTEVVQRMCSGIGDDEYSGFSILTSMDYSNREILKLKSSNFWPSPNVDSSVVKMTKLNPGKVEDSIAPEVIKNVRILFSQRRKTIKNNLKAYGKSSAQLDEAFEKANLTGQERAEVLTFEQIVSLTKALI